MRKIVVAVRGQGDYNGELLNFLASCDDVTVSCCLETNSKYWSSLRGDKSGLPVYPTVYGYEEYKEGRIDKFFVSPNMKEKYVKLAYKEMRAAGIADKDICIPNVTRLHDRQPLTKAEIESGGLNRKHWHQMRYLEFHISDSCNLNCEGCIHFSSLEKAGSLVSLKDVEQDFLRLRSIVDHFEIIFVLGGEPFLNPQWPEYVRIVRQYYPYTDLMIGTNGILLRTLSDDDFHFLVTMDVGISVTSYPPLWKSLEKIAYRLQETGVRHIISAPVVSFRSCLQLSGGLDAKFNRQSCGAGCYNMHKGKMAPCPIMMYISTFNRYFHTNLPENQPVDLSDVTDFEELETKLSQPMALCGYCNQTKDVPWSNIKASRADLGAWCVDKN